MTGPLGAGYSLLPDGEAGGGAGHMGEPTSRKALKLRAQDPNAFL